MREKDALKGMCEVQPLNADQSGRRLHEVARVAGRLPSSFSAWSSGLCLVQPRSSEHLYWPAASQDTNKARFTDRQGGCVSRPKKPVCQAWFSSSHRQGHLTAVRGCNLDLAMFQFPRCGGVVTFTGQIGLGNGKKSKMSWPTGWPHASTPECDELVPVPHPCIIPAE